MRKKWTLTCIIAFVMMVFFAGVFCNEATYAKEIDYSQILNKWMYTQYYQCLRSDDAASRIDTKKVNKDNYVIENVFKNTQLYLPSYNLAGSKGAGVITCREIATGQDGLNTPFDLGALGSSGNAKWTKWQDKSAAEKLMTDKLKYKAETDDTIRFSVETIVTSETKTKSIFVPDSKWTGTVSSATISITPTGNLVDYTVSSGVMESLTNIVKVSVTGNVLNIKLGMMSGCALDNQEKELDINITLTTDVNQLESNLNNSGLYNRAVHYTCTDDFSTTKYSFRFGERDDDGNIVKSAINATKASSYLKQGDTAIESLRAVSAYTNINAVLNNAWGLRFNSTDYYNLYTYYIIKVVEQSGAEVNTAVCDPSATAGLTQIKLIDENGSPNSNCYINLNDTNPSDISVYTQMYDSNHGGPLIREVKLSDVIKWFNEDANFGTINPSSVLSVGDIAQGIAEENDDGTPGSASEAPCYNAANSLGWIVCPVLKWAGETVSGIYDNIVRPFLQIKSEFFDEANGLRQGWKQFRDMANVLFVLAFVVVILAQITGIGISNYNVKRILPRLIVVAILVNASFILCQIAIDVSNIAGAGLQNLFTGFADKISYEGGAGYADAGDLHWYSLGPMVSTIVSVLFGAAGGTLLALNWSVWLFPFLLAVLGCVISVLFFFLILGVRQAGVLILTALAPLAIVCYALPNTKSLFDKWKKMFVALLMVYPICGVLIGGGQYATALLVSTGGDNFFFDLVAMLVSVVPFFFIPSIVRGSMSMIGNIGAKISGFGKGIQGKTTGAIRGSKFYREHQAEEQRRVDTAKDQRLVRRLQRRGQGRGLIAGARGLIGLDPLSNRAITRMGIAQSSIDKTTDLTAQAINAKWENDGTINDEKKLQDIFEESSRRLFTHPNDRGALEMRKAAETALVSKNGKTRSALFDSYETLTDEVRDMTDGKAKDAAMQSLLRSANSLMRTNAGDVGKSILLKEQLKALQGGDAFAKGTDGKYKVDDLSRHVLGGSTDSLSKHALSTMSKKDLGRYLKAVKNTFGEDSLQYKRITNTAADLLNDPRELSNTEGDALPLIRQLASRKIARGNVDASVSAVAGASDADFSNLRSYLSDSTIDDDASGKKAAKDAMAHALLRTIDSSPENADFSVSASRANEINKILQDEGYDLATLASEYGISTTDLQDRIDTATGVKVPHRQTLAEKHGDWRQATAEDVSSARAVGSDSRFKVGDWIRVGRDTDSSTGTEFDSSWRKLSDAELYEVQEMLKREAAEKLAKDDEDYRSSHP